MTISDQIKERVPMTVAAPFYGLHVDRGGFCCCPFHGEKTASMKVYDGLRGWHCFGCHKGGSVIDFVAELFGLSFLDAEKRLDADFNLGLFQGEQDPKVRQRARLAARARKKALEDRDRYHRDLWMDYDQALTAFTEADKLVDETRRLPPFYWSSRHRAALRLIDSLWDDLVNAEAKLKQFERENHVSGKPPEEVKK